MQRSSMYIYVALLRRFVTFIFLVLRISFSPLFLSLYHLSPSRFVSSRLNNLAHGPIIAPTIYIIRGEEATAQELVMRDVLRKSNDN